jgi:predicted permease
LGLSISACFHLSWKQISNNSEIFWLTVGKFIFPLLAWGVGILLSLSKRDLVFFILFCDSSLATQTCIHANQYKLNEKVQTNFVVLSVFLAI